MISAAALDKAGVMDQLNVVRRLGLSRLYIRIPVTSALLALGGIIYINDHLVECTNITGVSMNPSLSPHWEDRKESDCIIWDKRHGGRTVKRGDIIKFSGPRRPEADATKRVIALEGDTVVLDPKRRPTETNDDRASTKMWDSWPDGRVVIPKGHIWVEGDNWRKSSDSNFYGPISRSLVHGKAVFLVWPPSRFAQRPWEEWQHVKEIRKTRVIESVWPLHDEDI